MSSNTVIPESIDIYKRFCQKLDNNSYREKLYAIFEFYINDIQDLVEFATVDNNGIRPENLSNEMYSTFHHISRSLIYCDNIDESIKELDTAKTSHLKRTVLDAYKIIISTILDEDNKISDVLEEAVLDTDFRETITRSVDDIKKLRTIKGTIKKFYLNAKKAERTGDFDTAIENYNKALDSAKELKSIIDDVTQDRSFIFAIKHIQKKDIKVKEERKITRRNIYISCILTFILTLIAQNFGSDLYQKIKQDNKTNQNTISEKNKVQK